MREELEQKLMSEFPFMQARDMSGKLLDFPVPCECEDGWFDLIYKLCSDIKQVLSADFNDFFVTQVKEKYGGLRFYVTYGNEEIFDLINAAEAKSEMTCEVCGEVGEIRNQYWAKTLCDGCNGVSQN